MASLVLTDCTVFVHDTDFTGFSNELSLSISVDDLDSTVFASGGYRTRKGGLKDVEADLSGFWEAAEAGGSPDTAGFSDLGGIDRVVTFTPEGLEQGPAYICQLGKFSYEHGGGVGELDPFSLAMQGTNGVGLVRGQLAAERQTVDATGVLGTPVQLGAGSAGKYLYLAFHVFSAGTTISVKVESDDAEAFTDPSDVASATITSVTTAGGRWMTRVDASSITDDWFRVNVTAITGEFDVAASIAIQ